MNRDDLTPIEIDSLTSMVKGMSTEQLKIIVQYIPVEIMCTEISKRHRELSEKISGISNIMGIQN